MALFYKRRITDRKKSEGDRRKSAEDQRVRKVNGGNKSREENVQVR